MKSKFIRAICTLGAAVMMIAALSVSSFAVVSNADKSNLSASQQKQIAAATAAYNAAKAAGDKAGMAAAHNAAEAVRNSAGYSGGGDGSGYKSTSSGSSSSGSSSSSSGSSYRPSGSTTTTSSAPSTAELNAIADQMSANSAAWWVAYYAGDQETMDSLHAANQSLASKAAGSGGTSTFNAASGTYTITTSNGTTLTSSNTSNNKQTTVTFETKSSSGMTLNQTSTDSYSTDSINNYLDKGGTKDGVATSYNNAAEAVSTSGKYGTDNANNTASAEVAVAQALLGLSNKEAAKLTEELENAKNDYLKAQSDYKKAVQAGDTAAAEEAKNNMRAAHDEAEDIRASYGYSGDSTEYKDGGYYDEDAIATGTATSYSSGGGFYASSITRSYTMTASAETGGSISPSGKITVKEGESKTFTITPDTGYKISEVTVDGVSQGSISSYTFENVKETHTISATFTRRSFLITSTAGTGGKISPNLLKTVYYGDNITYTITPKSGYEIESVTVDGVDVGPVTSYTFENVTATHTIKAKFCVAGKISVHDLSLTDADGVDLSGASMKSGYGFYATVSESHSNVTDCKMTLTYDFGSGKQSVALTDNGSGAWQFPVNAASKTGQRCVYIPVETQNGDYIVTLTYTAKKSDGTVLTETRTATITVLGSMYEDDFTGNS